MTVAQLGNRFKSHFGFNPPLDMLSTMIFGPNHAKIDITKLDEMFAMRDPDYDNIKCTFKGQKNISMRDYVHQRFGKDALDFIVSAMGWTK